MLNLLLAQTNYAACHVLLIADTMLERVETNHNLTTSMNII